MDQVTQHSATNDVLSIITTQFIAGCQARRMGSLCSKDPNSPAAFREGLLKTEGEVTGWAISSYNSDWLMVNNWVMFRESQPFGSNQSGVYVLVVSMQLTSFTWWGS